MILRDQVRCVEGRLHVARKPRHHDEWDPPAIPMARARAPSSASSRRVATMIVKA